MPPIKILVVDDSPDLADAYVRLIRGEADLCGVGVLYNADELLATIKQLRPDVAVVDLTMPGKDPLEAIREVASTTPWCSVLACSGYDDPETMNSAIQAGARQCVSKHDDFGSFLKAIRTVAHPPAPSE